MVNIGWLINEYFNTGFDSAQRRMPGDDFFLLTVYR
jgi:hypothetical protein